MHVSHSHPGNTHICSDTIGLSHCYCRCNPAYPALFPALTSKLHNGHACGAYTPTRHQQLASITIEISRQASRAEQEEEVGVVLLTLFLIFTYVLVNCSDSQLCQKPNPVVAKRVAILKPYCVMRLVVSHTYTNPSQSCALMQPINRDAKCPRCSQRLLPSATRRSCSTNASR
jgi:hypothetical protein